MKRRRRRLWLWALVLGVPAALGYFAFREHEQRATVARLEKTRDELRGRLARLLAADPRLAEAPEGGVLIGAPAAFTSDLARQVTAGLLDEIEVALSEIRVRKRGEIKFKTLLGRMNSGRYALDVTVIEVHGLLKAGKPKVRYQGDHIGVRLPVSVAEGEGRATLHFQWDSQGVAGFFCDDFNVTQRVSGRVRPQTYDVEGAFDLALQGDSVTALPRFPDLKVNLKVEPSEASWRAVDRILDERGLKCRTALKLVNIRSVLERLLDRGFNVKIPQTIFKPVRLPAGLQQALVLEDRTYSFAVQPRGLKLAKTILWYGADLKAQSVRPVPPGTPTEPMERAPTEPTSSEPSPAPTQRAPAPRAVTPAPARAAPAASPSPLPVLPPPVTAMPPGATPSPTPLASPTPATHPPPSEPPTPAPATPTPESPSPSPTPSRTSDAYS